MSITVLDSTQSTNSDAKDVKYIHGDAVIALEQTAGRGQRGNKWICRPGENLTFSLVLKPDFLPVNKQFLLSESVALAIIDTLSSFGIVAKIKWPNDIYVADNKICGVLIENDISGVNLSRSIIGIGLNVNQTEFDPFVPNPASMQTESGIKYDIFDVFNELYDSLMYHYNILVAGEYKVISDDYKSFLYGLDEMRMFELPSGERFIGVIRDVRPSGDLMIECSGHMKSFLFKEIKFCL